MRTAMPSAVGGQQKHLGTAALMGRILVVGAGFAGTVYARELAEAGHHVEVVDKRPHVAGNAYDEVLDDGMRVHRYGPHLLHTNNARVVNWLKRFEAFIPYEHHVSALLPSGVLAPLPVNRTTVNLVFGVCLQTERQMAAFLESVAIPCEAPRNAAEYLVSRIGTRLTDLFFRPYTKKMWEMDLEEMDVAVVKRIPLRHDDEDRYFPSDRFQLLPQAGYAAVVHAILDHKTIRVSTGTRFDKAMLAGFDFCFNSMPVDEYFDLALGPLPYRSIRFHHRAEPSNYGLGTTSVVNFTDTGRFTRQTDWSRLPAHVQWETGKKTVTLEEPCDYKDNDFERYYPVKTHDRRNEALYERYKELAEKEPKLRFIGRCGTYQYLDMDQVINQSLQGARAWIAGR
jgi:UDP-galactopyranose mutase